MSYQILIDKPQFDAMMKAERQKGREEVWTFVDKTIDDPMSNLVVSADTPNHLKIKIERFLKTMIEAVCD